MSESKQEARLPENIEKAIRWFGERTQTHTHVCLVGPPCKEAAELRSAILIALDEARDEALTWVVDNLAAGNDWTAPGPICEAVETERDRIRALKSKRGA